MFFKSCLLIHRRVLTDVVVFVKVAVLSPARLRLSEFDLLCYNEGYVKISSVLTEVGVEAREIVGSIAQRRVVPMPRLLAQAQRGVRQLAPCLQTRRLRRCPSK